MKRLFEVRNGNDAIYFTGKGAAKVLRDEIGPSAKLHLGPDHWRYGLKGNPKTHSHRSTGLTVGGNRLGGSIGNSFPNKRK